MGRTTEQIPVLALWSAPRSRSTAFARMMAERGDRVVVHEPFSLVADFGEVKVGDRVARSERDVLAALREIAADQPVFFKDTTDFHYPELLADRDFLASATHTFIIRDPAEAIASHHALNPGLGRDEIGFARLYEIFEAVREAIGRTPIVIDSDDLLDRPAETVRAYCSAVGIPFVPEALEWEPGMRPEWESTSRWHAKTSRSAGFTRGRSGGAEAVAASPEATAAAAVSADPVLRGHLEFHRPYYEKLRAVALPVPSAETTANSAIKTALCEPIDISGHRNNTAISAATDTKAGAFNVWGNSFAAEYLPEGGSLVHVDGVPFRFPPVCDGPDNVRCAGQYIAVPEGRFDWIHVLAASERRCEDTVELSFADGSVDAEPLRVSDFWAAPAWFGEVKAFESLVMHYPHHVQRGVPAVMWAQRVPVTRRAELAGILLPRNVAVHLFALTLQRTEP